MKKTQIETSSIAIDELRKSLASIESSVLNLQEFQNDAPRGNGSVQANVFSSFSVQVTGIVSQLHFLTVQLVDILERNQNNQQ